MKKKSHFGSILMGLAIALLIAGKQLEWDLPIIRQDRTTLIVIGGLGMLLCGAGVGRIVADKRWLYPISLLSMVIGAALMVIWVGRLFNRALPWAATDSEAILTMGVLMGVKWAFARLYGGLRLRRRKAQQTAG